MRPALDVLPFQYTESEIRAAEEARDIRRQFIAEVRANKHADWFLAADELTASDITIHYDPDAR